MKPFLWYDEDVVRKVAEGTLKAHGLKPFLLLMEKRL